MTMVDDAIRDVTGTIWGALLGLEVQETPFGLLPIGPAETLAGHVEIGGGWQGLVAVHCAQGLVRDLAGLMFEVAPANATPEQLVDALGEITNMTGGNLKTVLAEGCDLGQPTVSPDESFTPLVDDGELVSQLAFECHGHPFVVSVFARDAATDRQ